MAVDATLSRPPATNVAAPERIGSAIAGAVLLLRALARPSLGRVVVGLGGLLLLQRGLTGHCALYDRLGISTASTAQHGDRETDPVLCASEDSFPASDPPSWTPVVGEVRR